MASTYYNAKNLPLEGRWDVAATNYGVNPQNAFSEFGKIYNTRTQVDGGSKSIYDKMVQWASPEAVTSRGGNPNDTQWSLLRQALTTGQLDPRLKPELVYKGLGLGLSETARAQQHKKTFADSLLGKLTGIGLEIGGYALGGPWGAAATGALYGGTVGGDGFGDALLGGLQGYGIGSGLGALGDAASSTGGWISSLTHPSDFFHNLYNGGFGALSSGSQIPNGVTQGSNLFSNIRTGLGFGNTAANAVGQAGGGGGMSNWFTDSVGDYFRNNFFGDAVRTGINYFGAQSAQNNLEDAANRLYSQGAFNPYNINTPYGTAAFTGNSATATLSPEFQKALAEAIKQRTQIGKDAYGFNTGKYAQNYYNTTKRIKAPEEAWTANDFLDKVYSSGNMGSSTGAHDIFQFGLEKDLADQALRLQSKQQAGQEQSRLFTLYNNSLANEMRIAGIPNEQIQLGLNAGSARSVANQGAGQYPWFAAQNQADASSAFWKSLTDNFLPNGSIINKYGTPGSTGTVNTNYRAVYDPNTG